MLFTGMPCARILFAKSNSIEIASLSDSRTFYHNHNEMRPMAETAGVDFRDPGHFSGYPVGCDLLVEGIVSICLAWENFPIEMVGA